MFPQRIVIILAITRIISNLNLKYNVNFRMALVSIAYVLIENCYGVTGLADVNIDLSAKVTKQVRIKQSNIMHQ